MWRGPRRDGILTVSGRQSLGLVARETRDAGYREVLIPRVSCPTMVIPFELEGMRATVVECAPDCLVDPEALDAALATCVTPPVILHAEAFGNRTGEALAASLDRARSAGARIVADVTHSLLDHLPVLAPADLPPPDFAGTGAEYVVASLRKLLPVPIGGLVRGLEKPPELASLPADNDVATVARAAARHPDIPALRDALEDLLDRAWEPRVLPDDFRTHICDGHLDEGAAASKHRFAAQREALVGLDVVNPGAAYHPVVRHERAAGIRRALADAGMPVPLHWPGATDDLVVLPADARAGEMVRHLTTRDDQR